MADLPVRKPSPFRLNLEQQKKSAKELHKAILENDLTAVSRFKTHHPKFSDKLATTDHLFKLSDAQLVIARELGLQSWPKLKQHIDNMARCNRQIQNSENTVDADIKTLHIRCGSDLQSTLPAAGFIGDFLEYSEPYCQGPLHDLPDFIDIRARFLAKTYGEYVDKSHTDIKSELITADKKLTSAAKEYSRVVLWFEHDSYDQLILARILSYFSEHQTPDILELVSINNFPGSVRFIGMGQLPAEAIRLIWQHRTPVNQKQLQLGKQLWDALRESSPLPIIKLLKSDNIKQLPDMHRALTRHLQELPSTFNGLSLSEQLTLEMLDKESLTAAKLFHLLIKQCDPLPWLGDIMYWHILTSMTQITQPVFIIENNQAQKNWHQLRLSITEAGSQLLQGKIDWLSLAPPERWLGGIKISTQHDYWRWDLNAHNIIQTT